MLELQLSPSQVCMILVVIWIVMLLVQKTLRIRSSLSNLGESSKSVFLWLNPIRTAASILSPRYQSKDDLGFSHAGFSPYRKYGSTHASSVSFTDEAVVHHFSDGDAIKAISTDRIHFVKELQQYKSMNLYGPSIIGTEGSVWKRHRTVARTAFNEANHALVWTTTIRIVNEWFEEVEKEMGRHRQELQIDSLTAYVQLTLLVIACAGFGRRVSWSEETKAEPPAGHKMAFRPAITFASEHILTRVLFPKWVYSLAERFYIPYLTPLMRDIQEAFDSVGQHMMDVISSARAWIASGKKEPLEAALLQNLVEANMSEEGASSNKQLTDDELLSDTFLFLVAGHETTSHSMCFATLYLALFPEAQKKIYEEALLLWPDKPPTLDSHTSYKESMARLEYTTAAFLEAIRLFPPVIKLSRVATVDMNLKARRFTSSEENKQIRDVQEVSIPIQAGTRVCIDIYALHRNPIYWGEDAESFKPERFIDTDTYRWPREGFNAFSSGPRGCIGERFALTESTCALANLVRRYEILVPKELENKPLEERMEVMLQFYKGLTLTPKNGLVRLRRRV